MKQQPNTAFSLTLALSFTPKKTCNPLLQTLVFRYVVSKLFYYNTDHIIKKFPQIHQIGTLFEECLLRSTSGWFSFAWPFCTWLRKLLKPRHATFACAIVVFASQCTEPCSRAIYAWNIALNCVDRCPHNASIWNPLHPFWTLDFFKNWSKVTEKCFEVQIGIICGSCRGKKLKKIMCNVWFSSK